MQSLFDQLKALDNSGIFRGAPPAFQRDVTVHDYSIKALDVAEQQLFVDCSMERLYVGAEQRGESDGPVEFIIIDEADVFTCDDSDHIINKMVKETRKFGVGLVLAGQSFEHFSNDVLTSASARLVLGCPEMFLEQARRRLGLPSVEQDKRKINPLSTTCPRRKAFAGVTTPGENGMVSAIRVTEACHE